MAIALGLAALLSPIARAEVVNGFRFHIVTGDDSALTRRIAEDLYKRLVPISAMFRTELAQRRRMVYFAIGPVALRDAASRKDDCVVISAFTSSQVWHSVAASASPARAAAMTAVYAEPAPADQLRLIALLYRRPVRIAAIVGSDTGFLKPVLHGAAEVEELAAGDDINRVLNRIAPTEVLLAMPDRGVYNTENIRNILLSTYRHKQGVIGFSADMVKAGALATTYSDIEDINAQVAEMAAAFVASGELAPPQFPRYFSTIVNQGVARSLDIEVDGAALTFAHRPPARPR
jgi:ABC-type uncharacterized transport system substrate-binding protein